MQVSTHVTARDTRLAFEELPDIAVFFLQIAFARLPLGLPLCPWSHRQQRPLILIVDSSISGFIEGRGTGSSTVAQRIYPVLVL